jgi:hypothetical protein
MAVVTKYGSGMKDPAALKAPENVYTGGNNNSINSLVAITNGDSIGSIYYLGEIPSNAIPLLYGLIKTDAITGVTSADLGFYQPQAGAVIAGAALFAAQTLAAAATLLFSAGAITPSNANKKAWELAGLASDPGGNLSIGLKLNAAATATGNLAMALPYAKTA